MSDLSDDILPSATPSDDEIRRWRALPRDEQLARLRRLFDDPEAREARGLTMEQIREAARAEIASRDRG